MIRDGVPDAGCEALHTVCKRTLIVKLPHDVRGLVQVARKHYVSRNEQLEDRCVVRGVEGRAGQAGVVSDWIAHAVVRQSL